MGIALFLTALAVNGIGIVLVWLWYLISDNASVVDVYWSTGIFLLGCVLFPWQAPSLTAILSMALLGAWFARLAGYLLFTRILKGHRDPRYDEVMDNKNGLAFKYLLNFLMQGLLQGIIGLTLWAVFRHATPTHASLYHAGFALTAIGLIGSALADEQLRRFKAKQRRRVCDTGLWRYSRHPNYFFEFCVWSGFSTQALAFTPLTLFALTAPVTMGIIFGTLTIRITERHALKSRGVAFRRYKARTSVFFPWPPKS